MDLNTPPLSEAPLRQPTPEIRRRARARASQRAILWLVLAAQPLSYKLVTDARYEGQGLPVHYLRLSTTSDIVSIGWLALTCVLTIAAIIHVDRVGRGRTYAAFALSAVLLWLELGLVRLAPSEFLAEAGVGLMLAISAFVAVLTIASRQEPSAWSKVRRIVRNTCLIFTGSSLVAFCYSFFYPSYTDVQDIVAFNADAGVVMGAAVWRGGGLGERASPVLRERLNAGYELLKQHAVPRLVVTGSNAPGEAAEGEVAKRELLGKGVDPSQLILETGSHTSLEQVRYLRQSLAVGQKWSRFVIISDQYHLARVLEMCRFQGLEAIGCPSQGRQPFVDRLYYRARESVALLVYWLLGR